MWGYLAIPENALIAPLSDRYPEVYSKYILNQYYDTVV